MTSRATLIWPASPDAPRLISDGKTWTRWNASSSKAGPYDVVLPGQMVRIFPHELPKMREREKLSAARFSIEDQIGTSLDSQHIVLGTGQDQRIAVVDAAALSRVLSALSEEGIEAADIYADFDWLPSEAGPIRLADRIIFTDPQGYTIDPEWAEGELAQLPLSDWPNSQRRDGAISLRHGSFARHKGFSAGSLFSNGGLGRIVALLAVSGAAWLGLTWTQARALSQQAASLRADTAQLYKNATGQDAPRNPARAVTRAVKSTPASSQGFLPLMQALNSALASTENIAIENISYAEAKAQLNLRFIYPNFDAASEIERAAADAGGTLRLGGVREQNGVLIGDAVFEMGAQ